jgi:hypothetical protein
MNFDHPQIPGIVDQISGFTTAEKSNLKATIQRLWDSRINADYHPHRRVDGAEARERLRDCFAVHIRLSQFS